MAKYCKYQGQHLKDHIIMKNHFLLLILLIPFYTLFAQTEYTNLNDQSGGISTGYGSWGTHNIVTENVINDVANDGVITFYHTNTAPTQRPTIFFNSGWGMYANTYEKLFYFLVSQGYSVVHVNNTNPGNIASSYQNTLNMFVESTQTYSDWIDTTQVGLMGHSYGGGATIWLGNELFGANYNWGSNGRFIFMLAPWYSLMVTENDLANYPNDVKLVVEISNDDLSNGQNGSTWNTDERAIRGMFEMINIPDSEKDFIRVFSSAQTYDYDSDNDGIDETYTYSANHHVSYTGLHTNNYKPYDALDVFVINRIIHALADYTFNNNLTAKNIALGNGSVVQIDNNFLTDLEVTDTPIITRAESDFAYECSTTWTDFETGQNTWFLQNTCADSNNNGIIDLIENTASINEISTDELIIYPVPASKILTIEFGNYSIKQIEIMDVTGQVLINKKTNNYNNIDISSLSNGTYFLKVQTEKTQIIKPFIVK